MIILNLFNLLLVFVNAWLGYTNYKKGYYKSAVFSFLVASFVLLFLIFSHYDKN